MNDIKLSNKEIIKLLDKARKNRNIAAYALTLNLLTPFISADLFVFYFFGSSFALYYTQVYAVRIWRILHCHHPLFRLYEKILSVPWSLRELAPISKKFAIKELKKLDPNEIDFEKKIRNLIEK